jgi:hypothetical protein
MSAILSFDRSPSTAAPEALPADDPRRDSITWTTDKVQHTAPASMDVKIAATRYANLALRVKAIQAEAAKARADLQAEIDAIRTAQLQDGHAPASFTLPLLDGGCVTIVAQERYAPLSHTDDKAAKAAGVQVDSVQSVRLRGGLTLAGLKSTLGAAFDAVLPLLIVKADRKLPKGTAARAAAAYLNGDTATGDTLIRLIEATNAKPQVRL